MARAKSVKKRPIKTIMWALDALSTDASLYSHTVQVIRTLTKNTGTIIQPVYVFRPSRLKLSVTVFAQNDSELRLIAEKAFAESVKSIKLKGLCKPKVLLEEEFSVRNAVQTLTNHAKHSGADLILVGTHAHKGMPRWLLGSFGETLLHHAQSVPVFLVTPKSRALRKISHIVFTADLTDKSKKVLPKVIEMAKNYHAKLTIFHKVEYLTDFLVPSIYESPVYAKQLKEDIKHRRNELETLAKMARKARVKTAVVIDEKPGYPAGEIVSFTKKHKASFIAMVAEVGPVASMAIGSITRDVIRNATCPVWVIHTPEKKAKKALPKPAEIDTKELTPWD